MAIDWSRGYSATYRVFEVNPATWADGQMLGGVTRAEVSRDASGDAPTIESGTIELDRPWDADDMGERYLRVAMSAVQDGERQRVDMCTLLCMQASDTVRAGVSHATATGRSVLWPASRRCLERGSYAPAGANGAELAASMLDAALVCPVEVDGSGFALSQNVVFELGSTVLDCAWSLLRAGNHELSVDGRGRVTIRRVPTEPALELTRTGARLVMPGVERERDMAGVPNRYIAIEGALTERAVNDDPNSPVSTVTRNYVVDPDSGIDESPTRVDGETLHAYCERRLAELSVVRYERTYTREWWPDVGPGDVVRGSMAREGLDGDMRVESQQIDIGCGLKVTERSCREVALWEP